MPRLTDFPSGELLFLDTNCLLYHFLGTSPTCTQTVHRSELGEIRTVTSAAVLSELQHRLTMLEAASRLHRPPRNLIAYLRRHPEITRSLTAGIEAIKNLGALQVEALPLSIEIVLASHAIIAEHGLLTTDAFIVATMRRHGLVHLASNDRDFARVPGITVWRP